MNQPTEQQRQAINAEIFGGRKIQAIKLCRKATGCQLVEAKKAVEDFEKDLRQRQPEKFAHPAGKSGCMNVAAVAALLGTAASVAVYIWRT